MSLIATDTLRPSGVVKHEYAPELGYCREAVIYNGPATTLAAGTVLGRVTATGKFLVCQATAADGSQNAAAVVMEPVTAALNTDTRVLAVVRGPSIVSKADLVLGNTIDTQGERDAVYAALEARGILVNDSV